MLSPRRTISYSRIVDLSHTIDQDIPLWPGDPPVEMETAAELTKNGYYLRRFSMGEHTGTHINAPISFLPGGQGIDSYSADSLVVPAVVIDVMGKAVADADYTLAPADIQAWERHNGKVPPGHLVLVSTGWDRHWQNPVAYLNRDGAGHLHYPGIGTEAAHLLVEDRRIGGLGIDSAGVDPGQDRSYTTNTLTLSRKAIVLENLTSLDQLPTTGATVVIGILKLRGGSGSPASVLALVP